MSRMLVYRQIHPTGNFFTPGLMRCDCGKKHDVEDHHDINCSCGRSYNSAGQLLAPREQWGEETGETAADYDAGLSDGEAYHFNRRLEGSSEEQPDDLEFLRESLLRSRQVVEELEQRIKDLEAHRAVTKTNTDEN